VRSFKILLLHLEGKGKVLEGRVLEGRVLEGRVLEGRVLEGLQGMNFMRRN